MAENVLAVSVVSIVVGAALGAGCVYMLRIAADRQTADRITLIANTSQSVAVIGAILTFAYQYFEKEEQRLREDETAARTLDRQTFEFITSIRDGPVRNAIYATWGLLVEEFAGAMKIFENEYDGPRDIRLGLYTWFNHKYGQVLHDYIDMTSACPSRCL